MRPRLLVVVAAACFATTGTAQELGPDEASPLAVAVMRTVIGALVLVLLARSTRTPPPLGSASRTHWLLAGAGMAAYGATFFAAVRLTGVAIGTVVALGSAPLFAGAMSAVLWRQAPSRRWLVTTAAAAAGVALIVTQGKSDAVDTLGVALAALAGWSYAVFALSSKMLLNAQPSGVRVMAHVFVWAAIMLAPALWFVDVSWVLTARGATMAVWLGVVTLALAYWAYANGLRHLKPSDTTALTLVEPVVATLLAATILGERPSTVAWAGMVLVVTSLTIGARGDTTQSIDAVQH